uniref:Elongation of very long chain fatty acids protein n=1 Tax=Gongylonema pulchrum TaxID=637853 RepID=A0A183DA89_9BILA
LAFMVLCCSYYFLRSMKVRIPRGVAMFITSLQILQFVLSVSILAHLGILIYIQKKGNENRIAVEFVKGVTCHCIPMRSSVQEMLLAVIDCESAEQEDCDFDDNIFKLALFMDLTYLILFINFFCKAYLFGGGKAKYKQH